MQPPLSILLLEDNPLDAELIEETLRSDGVECETERVDTREGFIGAVEKDRFDLVFADYSLPAFDGMAALAITRQMRPDLPFIIISGRIGEFDLEYRIVRSDDTVRWVHNRCHIIREENGRPLRLDGIATDITERKSLEAQFLRAQRLESIGRLASGIAHDLNNILAPVLMGAQLLQLRLPNADDQRLLEVMLGNVERGADIVKQILLFARGIQGERIQLQPKHLILEIVKVVTDTFPKSVQVKSSIPEDPRLIVGDTTQIHQVLMNLCINARDAMPNGGTLSIRTENIRLDEIYVRMNPEAKTGEYVLIAVADTGEGIPQQLLSKIFDPFFTTKEQGKGTGLGLSTVQDIVKNHGGFINIYSEVRRGTEFKINLPVAESPHAISEAVAYVVVGLQTAMWRQCV
jgi:signal transduction histidine kinase